MLFQELNSDGLRGYVIFLDIDGTIATDNLVDLEEGVLQKTAELKAQNQVYLCSNSRNHERNQEVSAMAKIEYIETDLRKPDVAILDLIDHSSYKKRLVIGDKFMTDGRFAKNISAEFIKVKRIESKNERLYIKVLYWFDDFISKFIKV